MFVSARVSYSSLKQLPINDFAAIPPLSNLENLEAALKSHSRRNSISSNVWLVGLVVVKDCTWNMKPLSTACHFIELQLLRHNYLILFRTMMKLPGIPNLIPWWETCHLIKIDMLDSFHLTFWVGLWVDVDSLLSIKWTSLRTIYNTVATVWFMAMTPNFYWAGCNMATESGIKPCKWEGDKWMSDTNKLLYCYIILCSLLYCPLRKMPRTNTKVHYPA